MFDRPTPTTDPHFFGYGSLVNVSTHDYPIASATRIKGWRRVWKHTHLRQVAYLTVEPCAQTEIDGLIASVPRSDWAALDAREHAYDRVRLGPDEHPDAHKSEIHIYRSRPELSAAPSVKYPILLSYIDVVIQGYLRVFGEAGARNFFDTTAGWDAPILDDRAVPRYSRHQKLNADEGTFVDDALSQLSARIKKAE